MLLNALHMLAQSSLDITETRHTMQHPVQLARAVVGCSLNTTSSQAAAGRGWSAYLRRWEFLWVSRAGSRLHETTAQRLSTLEPAVITQSACHRHVKHRWPRSVGSQTVSEQAKQNCMAACCSHGGQWQMQSARLLSSCLVLQHYCSTQGQCVVPGCQPCQGCSPRCRLSRSWTQTSPPCRSPSLRCRQPWSAHTRTGPRS